MRCSTGLLRPVLRRIGKTGPRTLVGDDVGPSVTDPIAAEFHRIDQLLRNSTRFRCNRFEPSCSSTQDLAATLAGTPAADSGVVWTDHQTSGRGRQDHSWHDAAALDLTATFFFTATLPNQLALAAATPVVVAAACEQVLGRAVSIKWPNDVFVGRQKLAGVLIDAGVARPDCYLVGIGINCNRTSFPRELDATATSISLLTGNWVQRGDLLVDLARRLHTMIDLLANGVTGNLLGEFRQRLGCMGRQVTVRIGGIAEPKAGRLTALTFDSLELGGQHQFPLGLVQGIRLQT